MPTSWDQKRQQIANALAGSGGAGWGGFAESVGAGIRANPMMRWGPQGAAAPEMAGGQGGMASMPGFNYVPPPTGPAPVAAPAAGATGMPWTRDDRMGFLMGRQTPANQMAYTQALGQGAYSNNLQGRGGGGYTTSGRGGGRSSSYGGAQRGRGGLY